MQIRFLAFCVAVLAPALCVPPAARAETGATPPPANLAPPARQKSVIKQTAPVAAPRPVVQQVKPPAKAAPPVIKAAPPVTKAAPPVIRAQGPIHAKSARKGPPAEKKPVAVVPPPAIVAVPPPEVPTEMAKGSATGMPLPRFAALRSDEVNLRAGPGTRYPIEWVYKRRDLPVRIEREFEIWRLVADPDGIKGWVHQATLTGRRSFVVTGTERSLRRQPEADTPPVAMLMPGVVGQIRSCEPAAAWCQLQVGDFRGWLKRDEFWGMLPGEAIK